MRAPWFSFSISSALGFAQGRVEEEHGAGRPWNFPSSDFLILSSLLCLCSWRWGRAWDCPGPMLCWGQTTEQGRLLCFLSFFLTRGQEARHSPSSPLRSLHPVPCPPPTPPSWDRNKGPASGARGQGQALISLQQGGREREEEGLVWKGFL